MPLTNEPLYFLDLETTTNMPNRAKIVELACARVVPGGDVEWWCSRFNPKAPIEPGATAVHGITDAMVAGEPPFIERAAALSEWLGDDPLFVTFGGERFDLVVLSLEMRRARPLPQKDFRGVDLLRIYHKLHPRTLEAAVKTFLGREHEGAHGARADAAALIDLLPAMLAQPGVPQTLPEIVEWLNPRRREWIDRQGKLAWFEGKACFAFGKHALVPISTVILKDRRYVEWILGQEDFSLDVREVLRGCLKGKWPQPPEGLEETGNG